MPGKRCIVLCIPFGEGPSCQKVILSGCQVCTERVACSVKGTSLQGRGPQPKTRFGLFWDPFAQGPLRSLIWVKQDKQRTRWQCFSCPTLLGWRKQVPSQAPACGEDLPLYTPSGLLESTSGCSATMAQPPFQSTCSLGWPHEATAKRPVVPTWRWEPQILLVIFYRWSRGILITYCKFVFTSLNGFRFRLQCARRDCSWQSGLLITFLTHVSGLTGSQPVAKRRFI